MLYEFQDHKENNICEHQNKDELIKKARSYFKGLAIDQEYSEYEMDGFIVKYDQFDEVESKEPYYEAGALPSSRNESPYLQSEFI